MGIRLLHVLHRIVFSFLIRFKKRFEISEQRDLELRAIALNSLKPQFTEEELEYLEDLKNIIGDELTIDDKSRKILNKISRLLDISEDRISILEDYFFKLI